MRDFRRAPRPGPCVPALVVFFVLLPAAPAPARGQDTPPGVAAAERLGREGRHAEAADTLLRWLESHPGDAGVRWLAGQLLWRAGEPAAAAEQYEVALDLRPEDPWLRLELAELLLSLGRADRARRVALPLVEGDHPAAATAGGLAVLGTAAYWRGDLPEAVRLFEAALAADPGREDARRLLGEIREVTRPWARLALEALDDNQPYRRGRAELGAGFFLTPLWTVEVEVAPGIVDATGDPEAAAEARVALGGFLPSVRLDLEGALGGTWQGGEGSATWVGRLGAGLRLPGEVSLRGGVERERYLWTLASADTLLVLDRLELALDRADAPGWAGEAAVRRETLPDGNRVSTVYGWVLAPVAGPLRLGWAASRQDAEESRWSPSLGRYTPYFTPEEQRVQSLLAEVRAPLGSGRLKVDGSYGVLATEEAPVQGQGLPGAPPFTFAERSYTPWTARASAEIPLGEALTVHLEAQRGETAFYTLNRGSVVVLLKLGSAPRR